MKNCKCIVTDLDRTLLDSSGMLSDYTADALNRCRDKGIRLIFATARPERATELIQNVVRPNFIISNNGATIHQENRMIENKIIPTSVKDRLIWELLACKEVSLITVEVGDCLYTNYTGESWGPGWNAIYSNFAEKIAKDTPKISVECPDTKALENLLKNYPFLCFFSNSGEDWHQIMYQGVSKINAVCKIAEKLEISSEEILAFGDDYNDIELLRQCGTGVAVSNAIPAAKQAADFICGDHDEDGVAKWIEANILREPPVKIK